MNLTSNRILLAAGILLIDLVVFVVPIAGLLIAYVLLARPPWFLRWTEELYEVGGQE